MKFFPSRKPNKTRSEMYGAEPLRLQRPEQLDRLESETYDILIVGGGVTGLMRRWMPACVAIGSR